MRAEIRRGLDKKHKESLVHLFCSIFPEVIVPVFGSVERCARLLEDSLASDRILTAIADEQLLGFAGLHFSGREWFNPSLSQLLRVMRWGTVRVMAMGIILFRRPGKDSLHLDTLAVHPDVRGRGIGTQLIDAVLARAQTEGKRFVTLEVEDINPRVKRLYERLGFVSDRFERLPWPWRKAFAFSGAYCMAKNVARADRDVYSEESSSTIWKPSSK
ncbi:GNAT family N-acetyltransferase [Candidatus Bipolaricaulota bacterium]